MTLDHPPANFDELQRRCDHFLPEIEKHANRLRWAWIPCWDAKEKHYVLGVQHEGESGWHAYGVLQKGNGLTALDWVNRLNGVRGLSEDEARTIWASPKQVAKAILDDGTESVSIILEGVALRWDIPPSMTQLSKTLGDLPQHPGAFFPDPKFRYIFSLESGLVHDLKLSLSLLLPDLPTPNPSNQDVEVIEDEDVTIFVPGDVEQDPKDLCDSTLIIDLQTAADLYAALFGCG